MKDKVITEIENFLKQYTNRSKGGKFPAELGIRRTRYLLGLLGNPQNQLKVIHLAGTSGKGSTATITSKLLVEHGFKVGLTLSPHIIDIRERFQINNDLIDMDLLHKYFKKIKSAVEEMETSEFGTPTYFEIVIALAFYSFWKEEVEYAVVETGLGGLFDGTNVVDSPNKLVILTRIGLDHTHVLGNTYEQIAAEKAGIIQANNSVVYLEQAEGINEVFMQNAEKKQARMYPVMEDISYTNVRVSSISTLFNFQIGEYSLKDLKLRSLGIFQAENAALALTALKVIADRDSLTISESKIRSALSKTNIIGRFQIIEKGTKRFILDSAHNEQKMTAFIESVKEIFPNKKFTVLLAIKKNKDYASILKLVAEIADELILTHYKVEQDMINESIDFQEAKEILDEIDFTRYKSLELEKALEYIRKVETNVIITGSMFLLGEVTQEFNL